MKRLQQRMKEHDDERFRLIQLWREQIDPRIYSANNFRPRSSLATIVFCPSHEEGSLQAKHQLMHDRRQEGKTISIHSTSNLPGNGGVKTKSPDMAPSPWIMPFVLTEENNIQKERVLQNVHQIESSEPNSYSPTALPRQSESDHKFSRPGTILPPIRISTQTLK